MFVYSEIDSGLCVFYKSDVELFFSYSLIYINKYVKSKNLTLANKGTRVTIWISCNSFFCLLQHSSICECVSDWPEGFLRLVLVSHWYMFITI